MTSPGMVSEFYEDQFMVSMGESGVAMTFGLAPSHPVPDPPSPSRNLIRVRMSLEHAKIMTMILRRHLKAYERSNRLPIKVPTKVYTGLGVSSEDW